MFPGHWWRESARIASGATSRLRPSGAMTGGGNSSQAGDVVAPLAQGGNADESHPVVSSVEIARSPTLASDAIGRAIKRTFVDRLAAADASRFYPRSRRIFPASPRHVADLIEEHVPRSLFELAMRRGGAGELAFSCPNSYSSSLRDSAQLWRKRFSRAAVCRSRGRPIPYQCRSAGDQNMTSGRDTPRLVHLSHRRAATTIAAPRSSSGADRIGARRPARASAAPPSVGPRHVQLATNRAA